MPRWLHRLLRCLISCVRPSPGIAVRNCPGTRNSLWKLARKCSLPTRTRPGSELRTKTRTGCCGSTSRKARTCRDGQLRTSKPSHWHSIIGHGKSSTGRHQLKSSSSSYNHYSKTVLHRPVEPTQYGSLVFGQRLTRSGIVGSMGSKGDAYDNAAMESFFATLQTELLDRPEWETVAELESAIFHFIEVFYNRKRRHSSLGYVSPAEYETRYAQRKAAA